MAVAYRNIDLRPFLTADLDSWGQNWSSRGWTVTSQNFDIILGFFNRDIGEVKAGAIANCTLSLHQSSVTLGIPLLIPDNNK